MNKELMLLTFFFMCMMLMTLFLSTYYIMNINPIMIIIMLLIYTIMICMNLSLWKSNFMYSIILFLIMISGLLIIFLYFTSLISNDQINIKMNYLLASTFMMNMCIFLYLNYNFNTLMNVLKMYNFLEINSLMLMNTMNFKNLINMYEYPFNNMTIMSILYLLFSLFSIIKICSMKAISLRKIN